MASIKIETLEIKPILTDAECDEKEGKYFSESHYSRIIRSNTDVYGIMEDGSKKILLKFRKGVIPQNICADAFNALEKHAQHRNYNRGASAGTLNLRKLPKYVGKITKRDNFRIYYKTRNGKKTRDNIGNFAMSNIAGYYDKPDRNNYSKTSKTKANTKANTKTNTKALRGYDRFGNPLCRTTQFTKDEVEKWKKTVPLIKEANKQFKLLLPDRYKIQYTRASKTPKYQIANTAYSTITINYDWRTALHKDKGDLEEGFGNLIVLEKSKSQPYKINNTNTIGFKGGYLGFPKWGIAVDVRQGDFLAMDVHEYHCNTEITGTGRLSIVCYLRKNMIKCSQSSNTI